MVEACSFIGAFLLQILVVSVLYPAWLIRRVRTQAKSVSIERFEQLYPDVDLHAARERFLAQYRAVNTGIAVLGLLVLVWLISDVQRSGWDGGFIKVLVTACFMVQMAPTAVIGWLEVRSGKMLKRSLPDVKRKAVLQRRGLFDFISPWLVFLAVLSYFLFAAFVIYLREHSFPGFAGFINIGAVTLVYAIHTYLVYTMLYGSRKFSPLETHEGRVHMIGATVKIGVYTCIATVVFLSLIFTLALLELRQWEPFALSVFFVVTMLLCSIGLISPSRSPPSHALTS